MDNGVKIDGATTNKLSTMKETAEQKQTERGVHENLDHFEWMELGKYTNGTMHLCECVELYRACRN